MENEIERLRKENEALKKQTTGFINFLMNLTLSLMVIAIISWFVYLSVEHFNQNGKIDHNSYRSSVAVEEVMELRTEITRLKLRVEDLEKALSGKIK